MRQSAKAQVLTPWRWRVAWKSPRCHQDPSSGKDLWSPFIPVASPKVTNAPWGWIGLTEVSQEFEVQNYHWCKQV